MKGISKIITSAGLALTVMPMCAQQRPNIIFILADDIGYEAFNCDGGRSYQTPNIDNMAEKGMRFTQAYAQPLSAPSRTELMTGKYNFHNYEGFGVMSPDEITFGNLMKDAGYTTGICGKWQMYGDAVQQKLSGRTGCLPAQVGFDHYFVWHTKFPYLKLPAADSINFKVLGYAETTQRESRYKDPVILSDQGKLTYWGKYGPDMFLDWAENFIDKNKNSDKPFFLYYPMVLMHDPFQATPNSLGYDHSTPEDKSNPKYFSDMMSYMDTIIGKVMKKVEDAGIADNTLIIFTGDNGTNVKIVSEWDKQKIRGDKGSPREWGIHVPFIAYWKNHIKPGQTNNNLIDFTDVLPTFLQAAKRSLPDSFHCDGLSFYDQLVNKKNAKKRDWVFGWYYPKWARFKNAIWIQDSTHTWKLYKTGELYNLRKDIGEKHPISDKELSRSDKKTKEKLMKEMDKTLNY